MGCVILSVLWVMGPSPQRAPGPTTGDGDDDAVAKANTDLRGRGL